MSPRSEVLNCFSADACGCSLLRVTASPRNPSPSTSCTIVATRVKWTATSAVANRQNRGRRNRRRRNWRALQKMLRLTQIHCAHAQGAFSCSPRHGKGFRSMWWNSTREAGSCCQPNRSLLGPNSWWARTVHKKIPHCAQWVAAECESIVCHTRRW